MPLDRGQSNIFEKSEMERDIRQSHTKLFKKKTLFTVLFTHGLAQAVAPILALAVALATTAVVAEVMIMTFNVSTAVAMAFAVAPVELLHCDSVTRTKDGIRYFRCPS